MTDTLRTISDDDLLERTREIAGREQALTLEVIAHLEEVARRRLFAARGFSSLFEYCVKALGYGEPAAAQRTAALRLMRDLPEARKRVESGELKLASAAAVERFIRREEKETGRPLSLEAKREIVAEVSGRSTREIERLLISKSSSPHLAARPERARSVTPEHTELRLTADQALMSRIERVRELRGPLALAEIFATALDAYLDKQDPERRHGRPTRSVYTRKVDPRAARSRCVSVATRRTVEVRSGGRCEFVDRETGRRCESRTRLQLDHRIPLARGGETTAENLRHFCPAHNQWAAIRSFGPEHMKRFLEPRGGRA